MDSLMLTGETSGESLNFFVRLSTMLSISSSISTPVAALYTVYRQDKDRDLGRQT